MPTHIDNDNVLNGVHDAIIDVLINRCHLAGTGLREEIEDVGYGKNVRDRGDFLEGFDYLVIVSDSGYIQVVIVNPVQHTPYVLGGKVKSWTPQEPIEGWVERKGFVWYHKKGKKKGQAMTVEEMAKAIIFKIKHKGIEGRDIVAEAWGNREKWVYDVLRGDQ